MGSNCPAPIATEPEKKERPAGSPAGLLVAVGLVVACAIYLLTTNVTSGHWA
ncbi:MAG: hypothetical protein WB974_00010 [Acidobacteriaceae bacterium]